MNTKTEQKLQRIAQMTNEVLKAADRKYIEEKSVELGLDFDPKSATCGSCYADQALRIYKYLRDKEALGNTEQRYILREGVDVIFNGYRINAATITDTLAETLVSLGFSTKLFAKMPE